MSSEGISSLSVTFDTHVLNLFNLQGWQRLGNYVWPNCRRESVLSLMSWAWSTIKKLWDKTQFTGVIVQFHIYIISYYNSYCSIKSSFSFKESFVIQLKREVWLNYQNGTLTSAVDMIFQIEEGVWVFYYRYDTTIENTMINLKVVHGGVWWKTMFLFTV